MSSILHDWIFPAGCAWCGRDIQSTETLCSNCCRKIITECSTQLHQRNIALFNSSDDTCYRCGKPLLAETGMCMMCRTSPYPDSISMSIGAYSGILRRALLLWKHKGIRRMTRHLSELAIHFLPAPVWTTPITHIPGHPRSIRRRGWDPVEQLCIEIARSSAVDHHYLLKRRRSSRIQKSLNERERLLNARNLFSLSGNPLPKEIILIDDVRTTGASMNAATELLMQGGCSRVHHFTLAQD